MKTQFASKAAMISLIAAAGLWACSSDPKTEDTASTEPSYDSSVAGADTSTSPSATGSSDVAAMDSSTATGSSEPNRTPDLSPQSSASSQGSDAPDVAAMESDSTTADTSAEQSQDYENANRK